MKIWKIKVAPSIILPLKYQDKIKQNCMSMGGKLRATKQLYNGTINTSQQTASPSKEL